VPAQARFLIECRALGHILHHVGDVDLQFIVAVLQLADSDSIVEIASRFAVDGDNGQTAVVTARPQFAGGN